jgi:glycosyltransferase involved in cell wall biosynthesis
MVKEPRVVHVVPALFDFDDGIIGGGERYALELARHMADEVPTTLVTFGQAGRDESVDALRVKVLGDPWLVRGQRTNPVSLGLFRELRHADVVHCHQRHVLTSTLSAMYCRATGRRVFATDLGGGGWDISAYVSTDRWYHGHLHISEYSVKIDGHAGHPWAHLISGGVDTERFAPDDTVPRNGSVVFVGRLLPHKGLVDLLDAAGSDIALEIIGQPSDPVFLNELKRRADGRPVRFQHGCDDRALVHAYQRALCVVLPSVYVVPGGGKTPVPELLGQVLLEGMACGTPVVCTDVASMPEVVEDGVTGFVVPPNDPVTLGQKLRWLRDHPADARRMGQMGRRRVLERFRWHEVVKRCLEIYRS